MPAKSSTKPSKAQITNHISFKFDKETPGAWRLKEVAPDGAEADDMIIGSLYLRKAKVPVKPDVVEVQITYK